MELQVPEQQQISTHLRDKLDYCQQCHLHKAECRCEETLLVKANEEVPEQSKGLDIMLSTWTISIKGVKKTVEGIVVVNKGLDKIAKDETFRRRVKRELRLSNDEFDVVEIAFTLKLGETFAI
ncbi:hypothetical protein [Pontibacter burrus]|uniref:Uncharacterized protein n=1 Tax=Pontibacter burrus TaxID=2704466 RepID=A0A6B3LTI1_9BACT|nr:hypothetical protein [Pontibacter burrus]NEM97566.1 hypothetical protein [Pontibacter burrus]